MRTERDQLNSQIQALEDALAKLGAPVKRGPGRPKGSRNKAAAPAPAAAPAAAPAKRGPGRPKGSRNKPTKAEAAPSQPGQRRKPKWSTEAREAARARMKAYWANRRKNG